MSDTVKVIWDGANILRIATGPGNQTTFRPGLNEIPIEEWKLLTETTRKRPGRLPPNIADDPGGINFHLRGGKLRLAHPEIQEQEPGSIGSVPGTTDIQVYNIAKMGADAAVQLIGETMDAVTLASYLKQEQGRKGRGGKPRRLVLDALDERARMFEQLANAPKPGTEREEA